MVNPVGSSPNFIRPSNHDLFGDLASEVSDLSSQDEMANAQNAPVPIKGSSEERKEIRSRIDELKNSIGMARVQSQEAWLKGILDIGSGKRSEGVHRLSLTSVSEVSLQDLQSLELEPTNLELKSFVRSLSHWSVLGLIHHFSILGGSPNEGFDFGEVLGMIGRTRNSENPEKEILDLYIATCKEKLHWSDFQTTFQTMRIKASYWVLSGVMPSVIEKTFSNVLEKLRLKSAEEGSFEFVSWKLVEHLEDFFKRKGTPSVDGPTVNSEELKSLCKDLSPFLIREFLPKLTLCEDRLREIPVIGFFSFLCRPIDRLLNTFIHHSVERAFPSLLKKGLDALEKLIGGKHHQINYRMAKPILTFINGKLTGFLEQIKNPSPEQSPPPPADAQEKLKPLVDELMKLSKVSCMDVEVKAYLATIVDRSPVGPIKEHLQEVLKSHLKNDELRKRVRNLAEQIKKEWNEEIADQLLALVNQPSNKEKIREEIRSGAIKGIYSLMQYLQKKQVQEEILQKTLNLATNSLFPETQTPPLSEEVIHAEFESLLKDQKALFQQISDGLVDSVIDVTAAKWVYGNRDKQVNHHWKTHHAKITSYLDAGISDKIDSITNALEMAAEKVEAEEVELERLQFLEILSKHLLFWEGLCGVLERATQKQAPVQSREKIKDKFNWLYQEANEQLNTIADLKKEWDFCLVRRDLRDLYERMHQELDQKMRAYSQAKEKDGATGITRMAIQMNDLMKPSAVPAEQGSDLASIGRQIKELLEKENALEEDGFLDELDETELKRQEEVLDACNKIAMQSKNMQFTARSVNNAFRQLKEKLNIEFRKYKDRAQESRESLILKANHLQESHKNRLEKIKQIQCDKIPPTIREALGMGRILAWAITWADPGEQIQGSKQELADGLQSIAHTLTPLIIADSSEPPIGEAQAGVQLVENPLPKKNLYTWIERLTLSSLLSYYQSQAR